MSKIIYISVIISYHGPGWFFVGEQYIICHFTNKTAVNSNPFIINWMENYPRHIILQIHNMKPNWFYINNLSLQP